MDKSTWKEVIPTFDGLFSSHETTLLRPFSIFSLFRTSKPSLPVVSSLKPLLNLSTDPIIPLSEDEVTKAAVCLQSFSHQLIAWIHHQPSSRVEIDSAILKSLIEGYLKLFYAISTLQTTDVDLQIARRQILIAIFALRSHLPLLAKEIDPDILGIIFPPSGQYHHLSPLMTQTKQIILALQTHTPSSVEESTSLLSLLDISISHISKIKSIPCLVPNDTLLKAGREKEISKGSTTKASLNRIKKIDLEIASVAREREMADLRRPLRVAIELRLLRTDLVLSLATAGIKDIKHRATSSLHDTFSTSTTSNRIKRERSLSPLDTDDEEIIIKSATPPPTDSGEGDGDGPKWEEEAEESLLQCLHSAKSLLDDGQSLTLTEQILPSDWLPSSFTSSSTEAPVSTEIETNSELSFNTTTSSSTSSSQETSSSPCPLRTLFRLHDRYEEQRLAVWLVLPSTGREKMTAFMRGSGGRVGDAWDSLGLGLMIDFDSETLLSNGLSIEKHDKWLDLAARKNAKKIRKRARKTV